MPDFRLAKQLGLSAPTVFHKRRQFGIASYPPTRPPFQWNQRGLDMIGTMSDGRLAKLLGIGNSTVFRKRVELGIPKFGIRVT